MVAAIFAVNHMGSSVLNPALDVEVNVSLSETLTISDFSIGQMHRIGCQRTRAITIGRTNRVGSPWPSLAAPASRLLTICNPS